MSEEQNQWREQYVLDAGQCDVCGSRELDRLACEFADIGESDNIVQLFIDLFF